MQVDYREGQELMKLDYLNQDEVGRMAGKPAQATGTLENKVKDEAAVYSLKAEQSSDRHDLKAKNYQQGRCDDQLFPKVRYSDRQ